MPFPELVVGNGTELRAIDLSSMTILRITAGPFTFTARLEEEAAPLTCAAFSRLLPYQQKIIHARWSGEACWIPLGDFELGVGYENHTSFPSKGEILFYPGGISETEILFPYGSTRFASKVGQLAGNHFLTIIEGQEHLAALGRLCLWQGVQDIRFELAPTLGQTIPPVDIQTSYDTVALEYARRIYDELKDKPLDRILLDRFADQVRGHGAICDFGCGPGQVARYLADLGLDASGLDLSPGMVAQAQQLNPSLTFQQGNLLALDLPDHSLAGATAFYSLIHFTPAQLATALSGIYRVLQPGGLFLASFHVGDEVRHFDQLWEQPVNLDFVFFQPAVMQAALERAGFKVVELVERPPYENVEVQTQRAYIFARKPA